MLSYISSFIFRSDTSELPSNPDSPALPSSQLKSDRPTETPNDKDHQSFILHSPMTLNNYTEHFRHQPPDPIHNSPVPKNPDKIHRTDSEKQPHSDDEKAPRYPEKEECKKTDIVLVIDKSGSMEEHRNEMIDAINALIEEQKKDQNTEYLVTIITFNHECHTTLSRTPIQKVKPLTKNDYITNGGTALYDAIDYSIEYISKEGSDETTVVIITDGLENCSKKFRKEIKTQINQKKEQGWKFIYLASDPTLLEQGEDINIGNGQHCTNCWVDFSNLVSYTRSNLINIITRN